jgi:hypothetical protein
LIRFPGRLDLRQFPQLAPIFLTNLVAEAGEDHFLNRLVFAQVGARIAHGDLGGPETSAGSLCLRSLCLPFIEPAVTER